MLGKELVINGTFDSDIVGWSSGALETFEWDAGELHIVETGTSFSFAQQIDIGTIIGRKYKYSFDLTKNSGGGLLFQQGSNTTIEGFASSGSYSGSFLWTQTTKSIRFKINGSAADWNIDNVSIREDIPTELSRTGQHFSSFPEN